MKPTTEILENIRQSSAKNRDEIFTRIYRYMLRPDIYYIAYKNLYANNGAATPGVEKDTADGFGTEKVQRIILALSDGSFQPKPARRTYIKKQNGKMRPLGLPTFTDKLVQEVMRMILEAVYEPIFLDTSHGFRPNRSCHTALGQITKGFNGARWFIEGDIKGCFDNIDHRVLADLIGSKIKDARFIQLVYKFLKAGYMEDWKYNNTYSGTPQGGIVSPIFANIYLHKLDKYVAKLKDDFDKPQTERFTSEYAKLLYKRNYLARKIKGASEAGKAELVEIRMQLRKEMLRTPCKSQTDKKIKYVRYADDFLIGVNGSHGDCERIKAALKSFISKSLKMELSEEKTLITHSNEKARFLGYDIKVRRSGQIKYSGRGFTKRTLSNTVELTIPLEEKIEKFLFGNSIVKQNIQGDILPICRRNLIRCTELEIINSYNAEIRGLCNYYLLASNYNRLSFFAYLMEYSCLKTIAAKHKSSVAKTIEKYKDGKGGWAIPYKTKAETKLMYIAKIADCKRFGFSSDAISKITLFNAYSVNTFENRLNAKICELCGSTESPTYEIHHVSKVKDLTDKEPWERIMIAKNRKTMVVCLECHKKIHGKQNHDNGASMESRVHREM
jgi:RNA-directed DNA polymerase